MNDKLDCEKSPLERFRSRFKRNKKETFYCPYCNKDRYVFNEVYCSKCANKIVERRFKDKSKGSFQNHSGN